MSFLIGRGRLASCPFRRSGFSCCCRFPRLKLAGLLGRIEILGGLCLATILSLYGCLSAGNHPSDSSDMGANTHMFTLAELAVGTTDDKAVFGGALAKLKPKKDSGLPRCFLNAFDPSEFKNVDIGPKRAMRIGSSPQRVLQLLKPPVVVAGSRCQILVSLVVLESKSNQSRWFNLISTSTIRLLCCRGRPWLQQDGLRDAVNLSACRVWAFYSPCTGILSSPVKVSYSGSHRDNRRCGELSRGRMQEIIARSPGTKSISPSQYAARGGYHQAHNIHHLASLSRHNRSPPSRLQSSRAGSMSYQQRFWWES